MSSANRKSLLEDDESGRKERSLIKIRKRSGPRIDPCHSVGLQRLQEVMLKMIH